MRRVEGFVSMVARKLRTGFRSFAPACLAVWGCVLQPGCAAAQPAPTQKVQRIDRAFFFNRIKPELSHAPSFGKTARHEIPQLTAEHYNELFDAWDADATLTDLRWLAYILGTAYHETGYVV